MSGPGPLPPHIALDPIGLAGTCHRYPDRAPILSLHTEGWALTLSAGRDPDPTAAVTAADTLRRLATDYAETLHAWAEQKSADPADREWTVPA